MLKARFSVPAWRLTSTALPAWLAAVPVQVLPVIESPSVPVVPVFRLTSTPSAPAWVNVLLAIVSELEPVSAAVVVRSIGLPPVDASDRPRISTGIAAVTPTVVAAELTCGRVPAATRFTGAPLPFRLRSIDSATPSPRRRWFASRTMELVSAPELWTKM